MKRVADTKCGNEEHHIKMRTIFSKKKKEDESNVRNVHKWIYIHISACEWANNVFEIIEQSVFYCVHEANEQMKLNVTEIVYSYCWLSFQWGKRDKHFILFVVGCSLLHITPLHVPEKMSHLCRCHRHRCRFFYRGHIVNHIWRIHIVYMHSMCNVLMDCLA